MGYVTVPQLRNYRGITSSAADSLLGEIIDRATGQIETYCDRVFRAPTTAATHYLDAVRDVSADRRTLYLNEELATIVTVVNGDDETVATTHYVTEPRYGTPYRSLRLTGLADSLWTYEDAPEDAIAVNGRWGYATSPPADIQHATIRLAAYMYAQKDASIFDVTVQAGMGVVTVPQGLPRDVREILDPYKRIR